MASVHPIIARVLVLAVISALVIADIILISCGYASISSQVTRLNSSSNWLLALALAALWVHWFIVPIFVK
jgi:hypothetical protein